MLGACFGAIGERRAVERGAGHRRGLSQVLGRDEGAFGSDEDAGE